MGAPSTYEEATRRASLKVWGGCGDGRCRPCGQVHDFSYRDGAGRTVHRFACATNWRSGCPSPQPTPQHRWESGRCTGCGARPRWLAPDGSAHRTTAAARYAGWKRAQLRREDQAPGAPAENVR